MKYHSIATIVTLSLIVISLLAYKSVAVSPDDNVSEDLPDATEETVELGRVIRLLVADRDVPKFPLKDIFADPEVKKDEEERLARKKVQQSASNNAPKTIKVTTIPRLVGIVIRQSGAKALFVENDKPYLLGEGGVLAGRYRITEISSEKVHVREVSTGLRRTIFVKDE